MEFHGKLREKAQGAEKIRSVCQKMGPWVPAPVIFLHLRRLF